MKRPSIKRLQAVIRIAGEISAELAGVFRHDVERCVACARLAQASDPAWSVTEAMDTGKHIVVRFDRAAGGEDGKELLVWVDKVTQQVTTTRALLTPAHREPT